MITWIVGQDYTAIDQSISKWKQQRMKEGYEVESLRATEITKESFDQAFFGIGLFSSKKAIIVFHGMDIEWVRSKIKALPSSGFTGELLLIDDSIPKGISTALKSSITIQEKKKPEAPNTHKKVFQLTDAIGEQNKKQAWLLYRSMIEMGKDPFDIMGPIWWMCKNIAMVHVKQSDARNIMKPFVFNKTMGFAKRVKPPVLRSFTEKLIDLYRLRKSGRDVEVALEEAILWYTSPDT